MAYARTLSGAHEDSRASLVSVTAPVLQRCNATVTAKPHGLRIDLDAILGRLPEKRGVDTSGGLQRPRIAFAFLRLVRLRISITGANNGMSPRATFGFRIDRATLPRVRSTSGHPAIRPPCRGSGARPAIRPPCRGSGARPAIRPPCRGSGARPAIRPAWKPRKTAITPRKALWRLGFTEKARKTAGLRGMPRIP
jgi:hypothetical protein